jgi:hypothetical protein
MSGCDERRRESVVECGDRDARAKPRIDGTAFDGTLGI